MPNNIRPLVAGNWKMNGLKQNSDQIILIEKQCESLNTLVDLLICPPATHIGAFSQIVGESKLALGGQDCHSEQSGAHTGDLSAEMLRDMGASFVIVGHSERRADHGEGDEVIRSKAMAAWETNLTAIICVGETEQQRKNNETLNVIGNQLAMSIPENANCFNTVIAYEPVWAIGTGLTPSTDDIKNVHKFMRETVSKRFDREGEQMRLLYGGSVKPGNAGEILSVENVNGALVGGASLKADDFLGIANCYRK